jgi:hypothetical protein
MLCSLNRLVRCLQAVAVVLEQLRDGLIADAKAMTGEQFGGERRRALAGPAERRVWVAPGDLTPGITSGYGA